MLDDLAGGDAGDEFDDESRQQLLAALNVLCHVDKGLQTMSALSAPMHTMPQPDSAAGLLDVLPEPEVEENTSEYSAEVVFVDFDNDLL